MDVVFVFSFYINSVRVCECFGNSIRFIYCFNKYFLGRFMCKVRSSCCGNCMDFIVRRKEVMGIGIFRI